MAERVADLGEFPLIGRLAGRLGPPRPDVLVGIGDDVAVFEVAPGRCVLATCDVQVAGVHFLADRVDPYRLGRRCAAVNLSDIAAMGGRPTHFLVSLALPPETEVAFLEALYSGLSDEAARFGADVIGGNVSRSACLQIDLTLLGEAEPAHIRRRSGARVGDRVLVTGRLGAAAAGLELVQRPELEVPPAARQAARDAYETPTPRVAESAALARAGGVTAMIDVSDGLAQDIAHICDASGVGVRLQAAALPIDGPTQAVARAAGVDPLQWAVAGGEDYELLFTAPPERADALARAVLEATGTPVSVIGEILPADGGRWMVLPDGREVELTARGWVHF